MDLPAFGGEPWPRRLSMRSTRRRPPRVPTLVRDGVPGPVPVSVITSIVARVPRPLNILYSPDGPSVAELAGLRVARVSTGSALYGEALRAALALATSISGIPVPEGLNYALIQSLAVGGNMAE